MSLCSFVSDAAVGINRCYSGDFWLFQRHKCSSRDFSFIPDTFEFRQSCRSSHQKQWSGFSLRSFRADQNGGSSVLWKQPGIIHPPHSCCRLALLLSYSAEHLAKSSQREFLHEPKQTEQIPACTLEVSGLETWPHIPNPLLEEEKILQDLKAFLWGTVFRTTSLFFFLKIHSISYRIQIRIWPMNKLCQGRHSITMPLYPDISLLMLIFHFNPSVLSAHMYHLWRGKKKLESCWFNISFLWATSATIEDCRAQTVRLTSNCQSRVLTRPEWQQHPTQSLQHDWHAGISVCVCACAGVHVVPAWQCMMAAAWASGSSQLSDSEPVAPWMSEGSFF